MTSKVIRAIALTTSRIVRPGDRIDQLILESVNESNVHLADGDVLVIASKIISKAEGRVVRASDIRVSKRARKIADQNAFDAIHVEIALREAREVIVSDGVLITETNSGLVCNFSGVDKSNAPENEYILLPKNPDNSAKRIHDGLEKSTGMKLAVVISDTQGRPWRKGSINIAVGCAGINAFKHNKGKLDLYGRSLKRSSVCQIDELASFAEPLMGQSGERVPVVIIRGYDYSEGIEKAASINRSKDEDLFR